MAASNKKDALEARLQAASSFCAAGYARQMEDCSYLLMKFQCAIKRREKEDTVFRELFEALTEQKPKKGKNSLQHMVKRLTYLLSDDDDDGGSYSYYSGDESA